MMYNEAKWLQKVLNDLPLEGCSLLNAGSSDICYRKKKYPYIHEMVFSPLEAKNVKIIHTDITEGDGVDIVGDLQDNEFQKKLSLEKFEFVLCTNLLEHVENKNEICKIIEKIIIPGGYIIVTVPYRYPYHYDPFDTMYRPSVSGLAALFPDSVLTKGKIVTEDKTYWDKLKSDKRLAFTILFRSFLPFYKPKMWWNTVSYLPKTFKKFKVTCILLKKL